MFRRVFVVHDHILPPWWVKTAVVRASYSAVFCYKMAVLTRPVLRVIDEAPYFRRIYVMTMPYYHRIPEYADRITGRVKNGPYYSVYVPYFDSIRPFMDRAIQSGQCHHSIWRKYDRNSGVMCMTVYGVVLLVLGSRFRSKIFH